jgi:hypothetical protein
VMAKATGSRTRPSRTVPHGTPQPRRRRDICHCRRRPKVATIGGWYQAGGGPFPPGWNHLLVSYCALRESVGKGGGPCRIYRPEPPRRLGPVVLRRCQDPKARWQEADRRLYGQQQEECGDSTNGTRAAHTKAGAARMVSLSPQPAQSERLTSAAPNWYIRVTCFSCDGRPHA